jgi:hypothetical protein
VTSDTLIGNVEIKSEQDGTVDVIIPSDCFWDCVECFGENRMSASFTFTPPHFVAHMSAVSPHRVEDTLRNWRRPSPGNAETRAWVAPLLRYLNQ